MPHSKGELAPRFPLTFGAMMVGLGLALLSSHNVGRGIGLLIAGFVVSGFAVVASSRGWFGWHLAWRRR
jgi:hypothetical protein